VVARIVCRFTPLKIDGETLSAPDSPGRAILAGTGHSGRMDENCPYRRPIMPLVRIDLRKNAEPAFGTRVGAIVYQAMVDIISVPEHDNFQVIAEHDPGHLVYDPSYLGIPRGDGLVIIQITLNEGRTVEQKKALYRAIAERLHEQLAVRREDVFVSLVEVKKENWSFGNGIAQYAPV
jgi:phenylpyruvate tautomerase PptA (4-oxalocrotonate tautomerase family)